MKIVPLALLLILGYHLCFAESYEVRRKIISDDNSRLMHKTLLSAGEDANRKSGISKKQSRTHYADVMKERWEGKDILHYQTSMGKTALRHCIHFTAEPSGCVIRDMKWKSKKISRNLLYPKGWAADLYHDQIPHSHREKSVDSICSPGGLNR